nr:tyrosine-type recombinase/integrase [Bradyrhizobium sp. 23]
MALPSICGLRGLTCSTLFALIAITGLRVSEALALDGDDLDADNGALRVRQGKNEGATAAARPQRRRATARLSRQTRPVDRSSGEADVHN